MKIKLLAEDQYTILAIMNGDTCPVEDSLQEGIPNYERNCDGLVDMLKRAAENGLGQFSSKQCHLINKDKKIYELIRGRLRLIFFRGEGKAIVLATEVIIKDTKKADKKVVSGAIRARDNYYNAIENDTLIEES